MLAGVADTQHGPKAFLCVFPQRESFAVIMPSQKPFVALLLVRRLVVRPLTSDGG